MSLIKIYLKFLKNNPTCFGHSTIIRDFFSSSLKSLLSTTLWIFLLLLLLSATCLTSHSTHVTLLCLTRHTFVRITTVGATRPIPCSPCSITQHIHLLRIHLQMVTNKITWCKMATGVALQVFIQTYHAMDFSEFVWEITVLPTANCLAKSQDCVPVARITEDLIANM